MASSVAATRSRGIALALLATLMATGCGITGPDACHRLGGVCQPGPPNLCRGNVVDTIDCNPGRNPGGATCCTPCPAGTMPLANGPGCR